MSEIPDRQDALNRFAQQFLMPEPNGNNHHTDPSAPEFSDEEIITLCREAGNATKFAGLFDDGDTSAYDSDDSRADQALASLMAFYTDDHEQLDRLISRSALGQRAKWRERADYRRRTINRAMDPARERYSGGKFYARGQVHSRSHSPGNMGMGNGPGQSIRAISFRGREKPGPREWIVEHAVCKGHPASWYGESGIAKSLLASHAGLHLAADGIDYWAGLRVQTVPVIYGDFELDEIEHLRRAQELASGMGLPDVPAKFHNLSLAGLPAAEAFAIAAEECARLKAGLFIVDSVGFALDGDSELAKDVLRFYRECIQPIRDAGATPLLIDHQAKVIKGEKYADKQEFGSVYKTNAVRSSFQIRGSWDGNELTATFTHKKTNFGPKVEDFSLRLRFGKDSVSVERLEAAVRDPDREPTIRERVLAAAVKLGRATAHTIANDTGIKLKSVQNAIPDLLAEGLLEDTGEKHDGSRIVIPHSRTTHGMGTGANPNALLAEERRRKLEVDDLMKDYPA